jgi:hypothetical protein
MLTMRLKAITALFFASLFLLSPINANAKVIDVCNIDFEDTFEYILTEISTIINKDGTEYNISIQPNLVNQPFELEVIYGNYNPDNVLSIASSETAFIDPRPYDATITYKITFDNDSLNGGAPNYNTTWLDDWVIINYLYSDIFYIFDDFSIPNSLDYIFEIPEGTLSFEMQGSFLGFFVNNNETYYEQFIKETNEPEIYQNSTLIEDEQYPSIYDQYMKTQYILDKENDLFDLTLEFNHTIYGSIDETKWANNFYCSLDMNIDYGRGIITYYKAMFFLSSDYNNSFSSQVSNMTLSEYTQPNTEIDNTTQNGTTSTSNSYSETRPQAEIFLYFGNYYIISVIVLSLLSKKGGQRKAYKN